MGPNFFAVVRSTPSSENEAARPAQRPALLRPPSSDPRPPAIELSGLGRGADLSSLSAPGHPGQQRLELGWLEVLLPGAQQCDDAAASLGLVDSEIAGQPFDQLVHPISPGLCAC
jgi:hypothetical protein